MLSIDSISVAYGNVKALSEVSMDVEQGSVHGIIGPNGAGKSTLMNVISGAQKARHGSVRLDGVDITAKSVQWRRRAGLSRSFQRTSVFPALTVGAQLDLVARGDQRQFLQVARAFDLEHLLGVTAESISYGDQRRVDIALAVVGDARVLLLDEPAAGLTIDETQRLFDHVAALVRQEGLTALIVEHDVDAVFRTCDVVTVLDLGHSIMTDAPPAVRADPRVITAYLGTSA